MLFALLITLTQIISTDALETTLPVPIILDGFTVESWNRDVTWNKTRLAIVQHLNRLCKHDLHCDADYGDGNIHLLDTIQHGFSSIRLTISADKPVLNNTPVFNYTALLTSALYQAKIDIEHLHDNQLFNTLIYSTSRSHQNSMLNRTSRLFSVLLGISIVAIVFALTIYSFQRLRRHHYSKLLQGTRTHHHTDDNDSQSTTVSHP